MQLQTIQNKIYEIRGQKVMLDFDLANLYEVETRVLNQAVNRNLDIFPDDFMFKLTKKEWENMSSQIVMTYPNKRPKTAFPFAFTEHGVTMLSNVLKSKKARKTSVSIDRAFIALKKIILYNSELSTRLDTIEKKYNKKFQDVIKAIDYLLQKDNLETEQRERKRIGYK